MTTTTDYVEPILESMYECRRQMVPCFIGAPGIGKTQGIYQFAKKKGVNVVTFILSNTVPSEVSGIRMPDQESKKMEVFDDMRMASLQDGDILFFDEILEAPPMLWSACLTLIQDRIMASGRKLPDVFIVAASNKVASPSIIPASIRDRFQWIELTFNQTAWIKWFEDKYNVYFNDTIIRNLRLKEDSDQYNILTPRTFTKLFEWYRKAKDKELVEYIIMCTYDVALKDTLIALNKSVPSARHQLRWAIKDIDESLWPEEMDSYTYKEILEKLQASSKWKEIQKALSNIEFMEEVPY